MVRSEVRGLFLVFLLLLAVNSSFAIGLGVSGDVFMKGILRGGYGVSTLTISNPNDFPMTPTFEAMGDAASWITFEPDYKDVVIEPHSFKEINIIIQPPMFTPNGVYSATLIFISNPAAGVQGASSGMRVAAGSALNAYIEVSDVEVQKMLLNNILISKQEECTPIVFTVTTSNPGNVELTPTYTATLTNNVDSKITVSKTFNLNSIRPTLKRSDVLSIEANAVPGYLCIPKGEYTLQMTGKYKDTQFYSGSTKFTVLEKGALSVNGILASVSHSDKGRLGEPLKVVGIFDNTGELNERAKLKVEVYKEDRLIDVMEGSETLVQPGTKGSLVAYFIPKELGSYALLTSAAFEGKSTDAQRSDITVELGTTVVIVALAIFVLVVIVAAVLIVKKLRS